jgi:hypothetical protein
VTAIPSAPVLPIPRLRAIWDLLRQWWLRTPLTALVLYCVVSVNLQENYPFSHFPMYSNPSAERPYYVLADGSGNPLPIATLTGITCPKVGKLYRTECQERAAKLTQELRKQWMTELAGEPVLKRWWQRLTARKPSVKADKLSPEDRQAIGAKMFAFYRHEAANRKQVLPPKLQLIRMEISYADGKFIETPQLIANEE